MRFLLLLALVSVGSVAAAVDIPSLAAGQWQLTGRVTATACARGRCATRRQSVNQAFEVTPDGGSAEALVVPVCPGVVLPDEDALLALEPGQNGWLRVRVLDRRALVRFLRQCTGYSTLRLKRLQARVRVEPSGEVFEVRESMSFTVVVRGVFVEASGAARLFGTRTAPLDETAALPQRTPEAAVVSALVRALTAVTTP